MEIYQGQAGVTKVEIRFDEDTIWISQKQMTELYDKDVRTINEHIKNIFSTVELIEESTVRKFRIVQKAGSKHTPISYTQ